MACTSQSESKDRQSMIDNIIKPKSRLKKLVFNCARIKAIIFNQTREKFALLWCNVAKEVEVDQMDFEILSEYCSSKENDPLHNQGFSIYNSTSLKEIFCFNKTRYQIAGVKDFTIRQMSMLYDTQRFAMVFECKPKQVYFFDLDHQRAKAPIDSIINLNHNQVSVNIEEASSHDFKLLDIFKPEYKTPDE